MKLLDAERGFAVLGVLLLVYAVAVLLWGEPVLGFAALVLAPVCFGLSWVVLRARAHDREFERWRNDPETVTQWLREMGMDEEQIATFWGPERRSE